jgi:hypothetical protein
MTDSSSGRASGLRSNRPRHHFTPCEDAQLLRLKHSYREATWDQIAQHFVDRTARQCRERYINYLAPSVHNRPWSEQEDMLLLQKVQEIGHLWGRLAGLFEGRSESDVKNRWHKHLKPRLPFEAQNQTYLPFRATTPRHVPRPQAPPCEGPVEDDTPPAAEPAPFDLWEPSFLNLEIDYEF